MRLTWGRRDADRVRAALTVPADHLPFIRPEAIALPERPRGLVVDHVERAFPNHQSRGTRLILTQSAYVIQKWIDVLGPDAGICLTGDDAALRRSAPEIFARRGPWSSFEAEAQPSAISHQPSTISDQPSHLALLATAYSTPSTSDRLTLCREAIAGAPDSPVAHLAAASACREADDMNGARAALDRALELAPDWEAVHYEDGKFWLGYDDMERARDGFQKAADRMPSFAAAFSNLGATLGELDEPERALAAFRQALVYDPHGFQILNNVGVVSRELGHLDESEAAFRRVIEIAPDFVFGYYNLGHTLFLSGRYAEALDFYEQGQQRDVEKNRRQGCRLAVVRFANGDLAGAERELWRFANQAPAPERADLLLEAYAIARAVVSARPATPAERAFLDRIGAELTQ